MRPKLLHMTASENICKFEEDDKTLWGTKYFFL
jgi:hypothetical protein